MPGNFPPDSVGLVAPRRYRHQRPLPLECGSVLPSFDMVYETYGELNAARSNAVLICHALSGDHHAAGYHAPEDAKPGWWENMIGPGKAIDTRSFYVVCPNNLGGCGGSSGPNEIDPATGKVYGPDFPFVTVRDWVNSQALLAEELGIACWAAVIGGSLGGMQGLEWAIRRPQQVRYVFAIAAAPKLSTQNIAFNEVARQAIRSDPDYRGGHYYDQGARPPSRGLMLARMLGHITYLSDDSLAQKFGRDLRDGEIKFGYDAEFQVESYLRHQGRAFVDRFDANSYLLMTKTLDYFDLAARAGGDLAAAFAAAQAGFYVISFSSDWRFSPSRSREIVDALMRTGKKVSYIVVESEKGHDSFLMPIPLYHQVMRTAMRRIAEEIFGGPLPPERPSERS